jgi:glycosyltransferase involved in cell wall biosynthesis
MKILHIIGLAHGGAGQHVLSLAAGCDPRRFESTVAMSDTSPMRSQFDHGGVRVLPLALDHYGGLRRNVVAFGQLLRILRRESFDVIQTHTSVAGALGRIAAKRSTRAPVVHMLHAFAAHCGRSALLQKTGVLIERRLDRWTDWYIAGSRAMVERGLSQRIFTADKVVLISNGIDLARFDWDLESTPATERTTGGNGRAGTRIGFLGRLEPQKGVADLVRAAAIARQKNRHLRFLIAGEGTLRPELEQLSRRLNVSDSVEFVGWKRDAAEFLREIDILAMPSLWEAFGLSAAEAMAMGKPVIASRIEGLPEVVAEGETGILIPPADPGALARAIVELADNPARQRTMGRQGRARVERLFTLRGMIARHETFYESLLANGHAGRIAADAIQSSADDDVALSMVNS